MPYTLYETVGSGKASRDLMKCEQKFKSQILIEISVWVFEVWVCLLVCTLYPYVHLYGNVGPFTRQSTIDSNILKL